MGIKKKNYYYKKQIKKKLKIKKKLTIFTFISLIKVSLICNQKKSPILFIDICVITIIFSLVSPKSIITKTPPSE